jgi:hypothetical protein
VNAEEEEEKVGKMFRFPLGTVKKIAKLDPDLHMASQVTKNVENSVADLIINDPFSYWFP